MHKLLQLRVKALKTVQGEVTSDESRYWQVQPYGLTSMLQLARSFGSALCVAGQCSRVATVR